MITDYITEKQLILYGVLNNYTGYTINSSNKTVSIDINIAFNVNDIDNKITELETEKQAFENDENAMAEVKFIEIDSIETSLDILKLIKENLS